jgi:predicted DNA-binding transcriptional regulator AlpA
MTCCRPIPLRVKRGAGPTGPRRFAREAARRIELRTGCPGGWPPSLRQGARPPSLGIAMTEVSETVLVDVLTLCKMLSCSDRHITRQVERGRFPKPVRIGRRTLWELSKVKSWVAAGCPSTAALAVEVSA